MKISTKLKNKCGIYCIENIVNGKKYIGKSINIYRRLIAHRNALRKSCKKSENQHFINSWMKYGEDSFKCYIIEEITCHTDELLSEKELFYMSKFCSTDPTKGYNKRLDSSGGMITHESTRKLLSVRMKERNNNPEYKKKLSEDSKRAWTDERKEWQSEYTKIKKSKYYILQYTKDTKTLVKQWDYVSDIIKENPTYKRHNIYAACSGEKPSMYGYVWKKQLKI